MSAILTHLNDLEMKHLEYKLWLLLLFYNLNRIHYLQFQRKQNRQDSVSVLSETWVRDMGSLCSYFGIQYVTQLAQSYGSHLA